MCSSRGSRGSRGSCGSGGSGGSGGSWAAGQRQRCAFTAGWNLEVVSCCSVWQSKLHLITTLGFSWETWLWNRAGMSRNLWSFEPPRVIKFEHEPCRGLAWKSSLLKLSNKAILGSDTVATLQAFELRFIWALSWKESAFKMVSAISCLTLSWRKVLKRMNEVAWWSNLFFLF